MKEVAMLETIAGLEVKQASGRVRVCGSCERLIAGLGWSTDARGAWREGVVS